MAASALGAFSLPSSGHVAPSSAVKFKPLLFTKTSLTSARGPKSAISASYQVTLITPDGEKAIRVPSDECIVDAAERQVVAVPHKCRAGAWSSCVGLLKSGTVRQDDQTFLDEAQLEAGFALMCSAIPTSDCVIETHKEDQFY